MIPAQGLFADGGATGRAMADLDWSATPLGPVEDWPQALRALVRTVLRSRCPMLVAWGPQRTQLFNDACSELLGEHAPRALGADLRVGPAEGWDGLAPLVDEALSGGGSSWAPSLLLPRRRGSHREEAWFSVSCAAAADDEGRTAGVLAVCSEVTASVLAERRQLLLQRVAPSAGAAPAVAEVAREVATALVGHPDLAFAALYARGADGALRRVGATRDDLDPQLPTAVADGAADPWGLHRAGAGEEVLVDDVHQRLALPAGPWGDPVRRALVVGLRGEGAGAPAPGVLVLGLSPAGSLDDGYRAFCGLLAGQVSTALREATAREAEVVRTRALAEREGEHARQLSGLADVAALLLEGGDTAEAVRRATDQARRLVDALHARTVLLEPATGGRADGGPLVVTAGAEPSGTDPELSVPVTGRSGEHLGDLVVADHPGRRSTGDDRALLVAVAQLVAALVQGPAAPGPAVVPGDAGTTAAPPPAHRWPLSHAASYPAEPAAVSRVRRHLRSVLAEAAVDDAVAFPLLVAVSEGVTNAIEHAQSPTRPVVDVAISVEEHEVVITVRDYGTWRPPASGEDGGHGSALMAAAGQVAVVPGPDGTTLTLRRRLDDVA